MNKFELNQNIGCLLNGLGTIKGIRGDIIEVQFHNGKQQFYDADGRMLGNPMGNIILYSYEDYNDIHDVMHKINERVPFIPDEDAFIPEENQMCWVWDDKDVCIIKRMRGIYNGRYWDVDGTYKGRYWDVDGMWWSNCAPFVGELPEHMKGK